MFTLTTLASSLDLVGQVQAAPIGAQVTAGSGSVSQTANTTTILQNSPTLSLNWQSFNVAPNEYVNFVQPNASSIAVNRILGTTASAIFGHLDANGQVWLINPNGILFGRGAEVNVGGLTASTLDLDDTTLDSGRRVFSGSGTGSVVNQGNITAAAGGYVALIGNQVSNQGVISAQLGTVALGGGSAETLTFSGRQLVHLLVDQSTINNLAENRQLIRADGGRVIMTAGAKDSLLASVVNNTGVVQARAVEDHDGTITLLAGMQAGDVHLAGTLDASSTVGGPGGSIVTSGASVAVAHSARIVAGPGGSWLIDPTDLTIDAPAATAIENSLNTGTSVTEQTTATSASGFGTQTSGLGDINVNAPITWTNAAATLTLSAYNAIYVNAPVTGAGAVVMQASKGNLTLASGSSITGDLGVTLGTGGNFINLAGAQAISAGATGRWLVYSTNPTLDTTGGVTPDFIQYAAAFQASPDQASGNGFLYSVAPTIGVSALSGTAAKIYDGGTVATLAASNYTVSGLLNGDNVASMSGSYQSANVGNGITVTSPATVAGLSIVNGSIPVYGYALSGTPVSAPIGTISPAQLSASIVGNPTKVYDASTTATLTSANYGLTGFVTGESATVNQPSSVAFGSSSAGTQTVTATFSATNFVAGSGTALSNYILPTTATGSGTVLQAPLVVTGVLATGKVYDATTSDTLTTSQAGLYGVINGDNVTLSSAGATGSFALANVGNNLAVSASGFTLTGAQQADYQLIQPGGLTASIKPATLSISGVAASSKAYDATTADTLIVTGAALSGAVGGDAATLVLSSAGATGTFATANAGSNLAVEASGFALSGASASNYKLVQPVGLVADISPLLLTVSVIGNPTKPYNGTTTAALSSANFAISGFVPGQSASVPQTALAEYGSANAGVQTVTATLAPSDLLSTAGTSLSNYLVPTTATGAGTISPAPLTGSISGNPTKVYDGTTSASLTSANYALAGFVAGEGATITQSSASYASPNAGLEQITAGLTQANYAANSGTLLSNYVLPTSVSGSGTITPAVVTGQVQAGIVNNPTKPYDGTTSATLTSSNYVLTGFTPGQGATVVQPVGQYVSPNAGVQPLTASLAISDFTPNALTTLSNYSLPTVAYGTGTITPLALQVGIVSDPTRVYNGSTSAVLQSSNYSIAGFISGEGAQINPSALINYGSANVGAQSITATLTPSAYTANSGTLLTNYVLAQSASGTGHITSAPVYITGVLANNKVYDTTVNDPLSTGSAGLAGVVASDVGNVALVAGTAAAAFAAPNVGSGLAVSVSGFSISGPAASNYTLEPLVGLTAKITPAPLAITGVSAQSKPYDATNTAVLDSSSGALSGVLGLDTVTLSSTAAQGTFTSVNVGNNLSVNASGFALSGTQAGNYVLNQPSGLTASITPAPITALIIGNPTKVYDGTTSTTLLASNYSLVGFATGQGASVPQSATAGYADAAAGIGVGVVSSLVLSDFIANAGTNLSNYLLPQSGAGTGSITQAVIKVNIIGSPTKVYDGTTDASLTSSNFSLSGLVAGQTATLNQTQGTYGSANAGSEPVTSALTGANFTAGSGTNLSNYLLPVVAAGTGAITPAPLVIVGATTTARVYDATTVDALTGVSFTGTLYNGDQPVLTNTTSGLLGNGGNVGTDVVTTAIGLTGPGSGNYAVIQPAGLSAVISPATLSATSSLTRTYDGTSVASLSAGNTTLSGFVGGQGATVNAGVTGTFASPNVGSGIAVTGGALGVNDLTAQSGTLLSNYVLPANDNGVGTITPATLTYTASPSSQVYGVTPSGFTGSVTGFVNGENLATATTGSAGFSTLATGSSNVGHYAITGAGLAADNGNYVFVQADANATALTITPAALVIVGVTTTAQVYNATTIDALTGATLTGTLYNGDLPVLTNFATGTLANNGNVGTDAVTTSMGLSGQGSGNYTVSQPTGLSAVISAAGLTASSVVTKTYDGTSVASLAGGNTTLGGFLGGQGATVNAGVTGTFASPNAGSGISVTAGPLSAANLTANAGTNLSNYVLPTSDNGTGTITPAVLSVTGSRVYDAQVDANGAVFGTAGTVAGVAGETLTVSGSASLAAKNVGTQSLSSLGTLTLGDGTGAASNYTLVGGTDSVRITPLAITVTGTGSNKVYNGGVTDAVTLATSGVLGGDSITLGDTSASFSDKNVGTGKTVTISGISSTGTDGANYSVNTTATTTANITPAVVNLTGTRTYDSVLDANGSVFGTSGTVAGVAGETLVVSGSGTLAAKNVGNETLSSLGTLVLGNGAGGGLASNYILTGGTDTVLITKLAVAVGATASSKVYDGNTVASVALAGATLPGDSVTFNDTAAAFATKNVGTSKVVTVTGITETGADAGNYSINSTATTTANITPLSITVTGTGINKVYNANVTAAVTLASTGVLAGDSLTFADTAASFADKNVGTGKVVSISGITASGAGSGNYTFNASASTAANITPAVISITGTRVYDGTLNANASVFGTAGSVNGVSGETLALSGIGTVAAKNVGTESLSSLGTLALNDGTGGGVASNYTLVGGADSVHITPLAITVSGTGTSKVYNGNVTDAVTLASSGVLSGDSLTFADTSATFGDKNVGTGKTVTISGISASGTGSGNYTVNATATTTANITPLAITVNGTGSNKVYDGNVTDAVTLASSGVLSGDSLTFADTSATFGDKNVGTGKTVTISGISASGTGSGNYTVNSTASSTANITPLAITVNGTGSNKVYDGGVADVVTLASSGVLSGDSLTFADTSANFANKNVGTGKTVTISGITASGTGVGNYTVNATATTAANITPLAITVNGTGSNKVYNGNVTDAVTLASSGVLSGDSLTFADTSASFGDKNVGTGKTVTISGITASGTGSGNYTVNGTATTAANITPLAITVNGTGSNKVYDGGVADVVSLASSGVLSGDSLTFADTSANFGDKNVGTGKTVTISGITASGTGSANYTVNGTATTAANITPLAITVNATGSNKVYDGGVADAVTLASSGVVSGDSLSFAETSAAFDDKNVGTGKTVTVSGITVAGADAGNYTVNGATTTAANITPLAITVNGTGSNKVYDGGVADVVTLASSGVLSGDSLTFADTSASFGDKNVGTGKTVNISGITASGTGSGNYTVNGTATTTADITPLAITVNGTGSNKVYDGGVADVVTLASSGVLSGDSLTFADTSATFGDKNVGTGKTVTISGITASGTGSGNYTVNGTATTAADITPLAITVNGTGSNKVYDGGVADVVTLASSGVLSGDVLTFTDTSATFGDKNVGTGKTVNVSGITASGTGSGNYTFNGTTTTAADITPLAITVNGTGTNKVYDGGNADAVTLASSGVLSGDVLTFTDTSAIFGDKNVGTGKTVTVSGINITGTDAGNYTVNSTTTTAANITPLAITVNATGSNKVYDGSVTDLVNLTSSGVLGGDSVTFADTSATFGDKNVGTGKVVTISGISAGGLDGANYSINTLTTATADVTPAVVSLAGARVYDAGLDANAGAFGMSGQVAGVAGEYLVLSGSGTTAGKNAGSQTLTSLGSLALSNGTGSAGNYTLVGGSDTVEIAPLPITVAAAASSKVYNGNDLAAVELGSAGVLSGDSLSFSYASSTFSTPNVGVNKNVTVSGISALGPDAGNYSYSPSVSTSASITPATLTETGRPTSIASGQQPNLGGAVTGFVPGETLGNATTGVLVWVTNAPAHPVPGAYSINGSGLQAENYVFVEAPGNHDALTITAALASSTGIPEQIAGQIDFGLTWADIATPYGVGSGDFYGNNTGNARADVDPTESNRHLSDFTGRVALSVVGAGVRLPPGVNP